jgi:hypothetical protein
MWRTIGVGAVCWPKNICISYNSEVAISFYQTGVDDGGGFIDYLYRVVHIKKWRVNLLTTTVVASPSQDAVFAATVTCHSMKNAYICHGGIYSEASSSPARRGKVAVITFDMSHVAEEVCRRLAMHFA